MSTSHLLIPGVYPHIQRKHQVLDRQKVGGVPGERKSPVESYSGNRQLEYELLVVVLRLEYSANSGPLEAQTPDLQLELWFDNWSCTLLQGYWVRQKDLPMGISRAKGTRKAAEADNLMDEEGSTPPSPEQWKKMEVFKCFSGML